MGGGGLYRTVYREIAKALMFQVSTYHNISRLLYIFDASVAFSVAGENLEIFWRRRRKIEIFDSKKLLFLVKNLVIFAKNLSKFSKILTFLRMQAG